MPSQAHSDARRPNPSDLAAMDRIRSIYDESPSPDWRHLRREDVIGGQVFWERTLKHMALCLAGADVLCLASGGGQQSVVFGLLGANVTVVDLSGRQLAQDRRLAREKGYPIACHRRSMTDLSVFADNAFDLVYQPISLCFVAEPTTVYREVARVLRAGGIYRVEHLNPQTHEVEPGSWNGSGYVIDTECFPPHPEADELEHTFPMARIFNGLIDSGLEIVEVADDPENLKSAGECMPGSDEHFGRFLSTAFSVVCRKRHQTD